MLLNINTFKVRFAIFKWAPGFLFGVSLALFATGCSKTPAANEHTDKNANSEKASQPEQSNAAALPPHLQPTLGGDIERVSLAISMAHDAAKANKWQDAVSLLQGARKDVDAALSRKPRLSDEFEALKAAIDRTIPALENRGKEAEVRLSDLQTRIGAIKVNSFVQ